jgi:uncharacterized protein (DUF983 family)
VRPEPFAVRARRALGRAVRLRCPRCGRTRLFRSWFAMVERCGVCGLRFERAQGYWVGAIYLNYAATITVAVGGFLVWWALAAPPVGWQLAVWGPFCVVFPLWFFRYSRSFWLAIEYAVNPEP